MQLSSNIPDPAVKPRDDNESPRDDARSAIITGASQGLGLEIAKHFIADGINIMICARSKAMLREAQNELKILANGRVKVLAQTADVSCRDDLNRLIDTALREFGDINILVANAGIYGPKGAVDKIDWQEWSDTIDINLKGTVLQCMAVLPVFKKNRYGKILILAGGGATKPMPYLSAYAASKAGVVRFAETLAEEVKEFGIDVNTIAPGALNTRMLDEILALTPQIVGEKFYEQALKQKKEGGAPLYKGAALCSFLASPKSNGITGKLISAVWDTWETFPEYIQDLKNSDVYTLRRIVPKDRQKMRILHNSPRVAIIGCGLIGQKRATALSMLGCKLVACVDINKERANTLSAKFPNCLSFSDWHEVINRPDIDIVIIATLHNSLAEIALAAIESKKYVLIEKPGARSAIELEPAIAMAKKMGSLVRVGFNHRYHRALQKARQLVDANELGTLMFVRARYGHGGRIGYNTEWRSQPALSGGGELIDQGVHLIDLARWFLGDLTEVDGFAHTYFWQMPVDDNSFLLLKNKKHQVAFLHASCTEWKNLFSFEIYGQLGKIDINGLGGSYGTERITFYKMLPEMGPPETFAWEYPMADNSWEIELSEFLEDIRLNRKPSVSLDDAHAALKIAEEIYRQSGGSRGQAAG